MDTPALGINVIWTIVFATVIAVGSTASGTHEGSESERDLPYVFLDWDEVAASDAPVVAQLVPGPAGTCSGEIRSHVHLGPGERGIKSLGLRPIAGEPCAFEARAVKYDGLDADAYRLQSGLPLLGDTSTCLEAMGCAPAKAPWERGARGAMVQGSVPATWPGQGFN